MQAFETIQKLIRVQGYASLSSIASCSGMTKTKVLDILDRNAGLIIRKGSRITGVVYQKVSAAIANARSSGKVFWQETINYGSAISLEWAKGKNPEADKFRKPYCCGGIGDNFTVQVVLDTPENRLALEAIGMSDKVDPKEWEGYQEWKE